MSDVVDLKIAKEAISKERVEREERCRKRIAAVLDEEQCELDISMNISSQRITPIVSVRAK